MATTLQHQLPSDADISQFIEDNKSHSQMSGHYSTSGPRLGMNFEVDKKWQQKQRELNSEHQKDNREYLQKRQLRNKELQRQRYSLHKHSPVRYDKNQNDYKQVKRELAEERRRDYEQFIIMKKKLEDNTYGISPRGEIDYIQRHQAFADEKRRDYNIWLQQRQQEQRYRWYREVTPPGGLPVGEYEQRRKVLQETRKRDYRDMLKKKQQDDYNNRIRQLTPQGGLSIPTQDARRFIEEEKKRAYRDDLIKQKKSQLLIQAQQNGDIPVIDRRYPQKDVTNYSYPVPKFDFRDGQPILGNNPRQFASLPPGPENPLMYMPPEAGRELAAPPIMSEPQGQDHGLGQFAGPAPPLVDSREQQLPPLEQEYPTLLHASREEETFRAFTNSEERNMERKKHIGDERKHEYQQFLEKKERDEQKKREQFQLSYVPPAQAKKNDWYSAEEYEKRKYRLKDERHREYNEFMLKSPTTCMSNPYGLPIGQLKYAQKYRDMERQRNKEYNDYLKQLQKKSPRRLISSNGTGLPLGRYDDVRKSYEEERKIAYDDYKSQLESQSSPRRGANDENSFPDAKSNLMSMLQIGHSMSSLTKKPQFEGSMPSIRHAATMKQFLEKEMEHEYNEKMSIQGRGLIQRDATADGGLPIGQKKYDKWRQLQNEERNREYLEYMDKQRSQPKQRMGKTPNFEDNQLLFLGQYERTRRELAELRKKECIEYTEQSPRPKTRKPLPIDGHGMVLPLGTYESTRKNLQEERKKDFKVFIEQQKQQIAEEQLRLFRARQRASEPPRHEPQDKEDSQQGFVGNLGAYEKERHMINEERQRDYNKFLDQEKLISKSKKPKKKKKRKKKYISNSKPKGRPDFVKTKEIQNKLDTRLEGHHYYRTTGGPPGPSQSPLQAKSPIGQTYAELLEQKRRQEARYRQNDPVYHRSDEMRVMRQSPASFQRTEALY